MKTLDSTFSRACLQIAHWVILVIVWTSVLFADSGFDITIIEAEPMLSNVAESTDNIFNFLSWLIATIAFFASIAFLDPNYIPKSSKNLIKVHGVDETLRKLKHKRYSFVFLTIPTWIVMIAAAWYITAVIWIWAFIAFAITAVEERKYIETNYEEMKKTEAENENTISPIGV